VARKRGILRRGLAVVWRFARAQPLPFTLSLIGATLYSIAAVATTVVLGRVTEEVILPAFADGVGGEAVRGAALVLVLIAVLRGLSIVLRRYCAALTRFRTQAALRREVTDHYLDVPLRYHRTTPTGQLLAHADADVLAATEVLNALPFSLGVLVLIVMALVSLLLVDPVLTLVAVLLFPTLALLNRIYTSLVERPVGVVQQRVAEVSRVAHESFDGALVIKTLGRADDEVERLDEAADALRRARVAVGRIRGTFEPAIDALPNVGIVVLLLVGSWQVSTGRIDTGQLVQAMALFGLLAFPMRVVGYFLEELPRAVVATDRIDHVLAQPRSPEPADAVSLPDGPLSVEFDRVGYRFDGQIALDDVSVRAEPGETVAIVGKTGSGKSTLAELVVRMDDPETGAIRIGGVDVRAIASGDLRSDVVLVFQESFLFADTIRDNIALGAAVDDTEILRAARRARADEFILQAPQGLDSVVGERGVTLSGGQRQRVALARALVRRPRVLVLDDATSAVDPMIEGEILAELRRSLDTTTLIVAHRVSTIALADRVVFLVDGRLVAVGTHDELLRLPEYQAIVRAYEQQGDQR
jgi:ATP-binding cassette, subfamily B, bacterial